MKYLPAAALVVASTVGCSDSGPARGAAADLLFDEAHDAWCARPIKACSLREAFPALEGIETEGEPAPVGVDLDLLRDPDGQIVFELENRVIALNPPHAQREFSERLAGVVEVGGVEYVLDLALTVRGGFCLIQLFGEHGFSTAFATALPVAVDVDATIRAPYYINSARLQGTRFRSSDLVEAIDARVRPGSHTALALAAFLDEPVERINEAFDVTSPSLAVGVLADAWSGGADLREASLPFAVGGAPEEVFSTVYYSGVYGPYDLEVDSFDLNLTWAIPAPDAGGANGEPAIPWVADIRYFLVSEGDSALRRVEVRGLELEAGRGSGRTCDQVYPGGAVSDAEREVLERAQSLVCGR